MLARVEKHGRLGNRPVTYPFPSFSVLHQQNHGSMGDNLRSLVVGDRPRNATIVFAVATLKELEVNWYMAPRLRAHSLSKSP
jgi:hypothetical protein